MSIRPKYQQEIQNRIDSFGEGGVFTASDFLDIAAMPAVNESLHRLNEKQYIKRIITGVYYKPKYSELLGEYIAPRIDLVAEAIARKFNWTIAPAGNTALNMLHLSTQVPNVWHYVSDGPYRKYEVENTTIQFSHVKTRDVAGKEKITVMVIQAISTIGRDKISESDIEILKRTLSNTDKQTIMKEAITATSWVYDVIREICREG